MNLRKMNMKKLIYTLYFLFASIAVSVAQKDGYVSYDNNAEYILADISVRSNNANIDKGYIKLLSGLVIGDKINVPGKEVSKALKKLWDERIFSDIKISVLNADQGKVWLEIYVEERPRYLRSKFGGLSTSETNTLKDLVKIFNGEILTPNLIYNAKYRIKDYLDDKGYLSAKIDVTERLDTSGVIDGIELLWDIKKGEKVKIENIIIEGNAQLDDFEVKQNMKNTRERSKFTLGDDLWKLISKPNRSVKNIYKEEEKLGFYPSIIKYVQSTFRFNIFKASKFVEPDYEDDKDAIIAAYNKNGFRDARILDDSVWTEGSNMYIKIKLEEGNKYFIRNVSWLGNTKYTTDDLNNIANIRKGDVYNQDKIDKIINFNPTGLDIGSLYQDNGYLFFQITPVETSIGEDSVDLEFRIYEGKQARIGRVTVSGNTKTSDHVILREVRTRPGELFSRSDIIRTQQELGALGYFNPQSMNVIPKPNPSDGTVDIEYVVEEQPNDQVELSGGYGYRTLVGNLGVTFNNFSTLNLFKRSAWKPVPSGDGQRLSLRISSSGPYFQAYTFGFTEPWLGGKKPISFSLNAYHNRSNFSAYAPTNAAASDTSRITSTAVSMTIGKRLKWPDDFFNLFFTVKWEMYTLKNYELTPGYANGTAQKLALNISLGRNSTNDQIFPTRGSDIQASVELTPPYSAFTNVDYRSKSIAEQNNWLEYHKWKFSAKFYSGLGKGKIGERLVFYNRFEFGYLGNYTARKPETMFERFQVGGSGLTALGGFSTQFIGREIIALRGYPDNSLTPGYATGALTGATAYGKVTTEFRVLISGNPSAKIFALGFLEAGNAWSGLKNFSNFRINKSAGVGVRLFLPMFGLIGVDYGFGFDPIPGIPESERKKGNFHFLIGQQF